MGEGELHIVVPHWPKMPHMVNSTYKGSKKIMFLQLLVKVEWASQVAQW